MRPPASFETRCYATLLRMRRSEKPIRLSNSQASSFPRQDFPPELSVRRFDFRSPQKRGARLSLPRKRGARLHSQQEGAERRNGASSVCAPAREHCQPCDRPARLTALHCGVIRWWDPSAPPDRQGSLGPDRHPSDATEDSIRSPFSGLGGLLHTSPGNRLAKPARGAPSPFTSSFACRTPLKRMGIYPPYSCDPTASSIIKNYFMAFRERAQNGAGNVTPLLWRAAFALPACDESRWQVSAC